MEHNKVLGKGRLDNYLSWMGLGIRAEAEKRVAKLNAEEGV